METAEEPPKMWPKMPRNVRPPADDPWLAIESQPKLRTIDDLIVVIDSADTSETPVATQVANSQLEQCSQKRKNVSQNKSVLRPYNRSQSQSNGKSPKRQRKAKTPTPKSQRSFSSTQSSAAITSQDMEDRAEDIRAFLAIYGKHNPTRKHKIFSSDGFVTINSRTLVVRVFSQSGQPIGIGNEKVFKNIGEANSGRQFVIGGNEFQISDEVRPQEFLSGALYSTED